MILLLAPQVSFWSLEMKKRAADDHTVNFLLSLFANKHSGMKIEGTLGYFHKSVLTMRWARLSIHLVCNLVRAHLLVGLITVHVVSSMEFSMLCLHICVYAEFLTFRTWYLEVYYWMSNRTRPAVICKCINSFWFNQVRVSLQFCFVWDAGNAFSSKINK